jgi:hypothetical protein
MSVPALSRLRRLGDAVENGAGLRGLTCAVPAPALPADESKRGGEDNRDDEIPVLVPPRFQLGYLFLLFKIEGH